MNIKVIIALILQLTVYVSSYADTRYDNPLNLSNSPKAVVGLYIEDLATGDVLYDVNGETPLIPASITKSVTTATLLSMKPASDKFETRVLAAGTIKGGKLNGDVIIKAVGDPTIESSYFKEYAGFADSIVAGLERLGISEITGTVVVDQSAVPEEDIPLGWADEDLVWSYGTSHHAANFKDNKFILTLPSKKSIPHIPGLKVSHTNAKSKLKVDRKRNSSVILSKGIIPKKGQSMTLANPLPGKSMCYAVLSAIRKNGINIGNTQLNKHDVATEIYVHQSPKLIDIMRSLMFRSDNMMAESMLRAFAPGENRTEATKRELQLWTIRDVDTCGIVIEDGSGLSVNNRLTPYFLADIFVWMASHLKASDYVSLFPKAGLDGTMKYFLNESHLKGSIAMKTGSMKGVQSYAGYKLDKNGYPTHVIVVIVNNFACSRGKVKTEVENLLLNTFPE